MDAASPAASRSREATPASVSSASASASASSHTVPLSATTSADTADLLGAGGSGLVRSGAGDGEGAGAGDMDQFIRRMEMEKKLLQLQQRLELASVKAYNGWSEMSIGEIESTVLPPRQQIPPTSPKFEPPAPAHAAYPSAHAPACGSASQPLPASPARGHFNRSASPSRPYERPGSPYARAPLSPSSPRRRRMDEHLHLGVAPRTGPGVRRASSSATSGPSAASLFPNDPNYPLHAHLGPHSHAHGHGHTHAHAHAGSPLSPLRKEAKKQRSQSHSYRARPTTQDVDAARALTAMLGAHREPASPRADAAAHAHLARPPPQQPRLARPVPHLQAPPLRASASLDSGTRASATLARPAPPEASMDGRGDDDKAAVELMMFLAQSPGASPRAARDDDRASRAVGIGTAARVLFADADEESERDREAVPGSKLARPPVMAVDVKE
ncbi:hypothetical protein Q5752_005539 [Cryptotrichosporon argae]